MDKAFRGIWSIPPDNRVDLTFQKHVLVSLPPHRAEDITRRVGEWLKSFLGRQSRFTVIDIGDDGYYVTYRPLHNRTSRRKMERFKKGFVFASPPSSEIRAETHAKLDMSLRDEGRPTWNRIM